MTVRKQRGSKSVRTTNAAVPHLVALIAVHHERWPGRCRRGVHRHCFHTSACFCAERTGVTRLCLHHVCKPRNVGTDTGRADQLVRTI